MRLECVSYSTKTIVAQGNVFASFWKFLISRQMLLFVLNLSILFCLTLSKLVISHKWIIQRSNGQKVLWQHIEAIMLLEMKFGWNVIIKLLVIKIVDLVITFETQRFYGLTSRLCQMIRRQLAQVFLKALN